MKEFLLNLADGKVRDYINTELTSSRYSDFMDYYLENEKLAGYTINTELNRMDFRLRYQDADFSQKDEIIGVYEKTSSHDIWKLSNQSVYSEILTILQKTFVNPDLSISIVSTSSSFDLDFDRNQFSATSVFTFLTMQDPTYRPSKGKPSDRLQLASIKGTISIDMLKRKVVQKVEDLQINIIFDEELRAAAKCVLSYRTHDDFDHQEEAVGALSISGKDAAGLLNKAGQTVIGSIGRLLGARQADTDSSFRSPSNSKDSEDGDIVSFDDFIADKVEPPQVPNTTPGGSWFFKSAAEGLVGSIGKLLGADKQDKVEPKNLFCGVTK